MIENLKYATILRKLFKGEDLADSDWIVCLEVAFVVGTYLMQNSELKITTITEQAHIQPKRSRKKKRK
jgi:hypothetical protein